LRLLLLLLLLQRGRGGVQSYHSRLMPLMRKLKRTWWPQAADGIAGAGEVGDCGGGGGAAAQDAGGDGTYLRAR
jgi:hypothetical protein